jgi:hypothetical protein
LGKEAIRRLDRLEAACANLGLISFRIADGTLSCVVVQTQAVWSEFVRAYYLSLLLSPYDSSGRRIKIANAALRNEYDAITALILHLRLRNKTKPAWSRIEEPRWHKPSTLTSGCQLLGSPTLQKVIAAVSIGSSVFDDLPRFRNFYAHRNEETARDAVALRVNYGIGLVSHPSSILLSYVPGRPQTIVEDWLDDLKNVAFALCLA